MPGRQSRKNKENWRDVRCLLSTRWRCSREGCQKKKRERIGIRRFLELEVSSAWRHSQRRTQSTSVSPGSVDSWFHSTRDEMKGLQGSMASFFRPTIQIPGVPGITRGSWNNFHAGIHIGTSSSGHSRRYDLHLQAVHGGIRR